VICSALLASTWKGAGVTERESALGALWARTAKVFRALNTGPKP
jgi:hypothetical protein